MEDLHRDDNRQSASRPRAETGNAKLPTRVREWPLIGSTIELARDPLRFLDRVSAEYGDTMRFHLANHHVYLFNHPDAIEQVLVTQREHLIKDKFTRVLSPLLGNGLLISEGDFWRKQRRLAQPAFHRDRIAAYGDTMVEYAERAVSTWVSGETRDVHADMLRLTLDIVAKTLFGVDVGDVAQRIGAALDILMDRYAGTGNLIPLALPTPGNLRTKRAIAELDAIVYGIIRERRKSGGTGDLISMLLEATSEDGTRMPDTLLRDEAMTLLAAGHETTALTLGYTLHLLARHPEVYERLTQEIDQVLGDRPATAADLPRLEVADAIVRESMRLYPAAWAIGREATSTCEIGDYQVPVGTQLWVAQWVVHRDARWFPDPLSFKPERWANGFAKTLPKHAYFPFGGGPRVCIGNAFAMMEAVLLLVTVARRFRVSSVSDAPLALAPSVTLRPKNGITLQVHARDGRQARTD